MIPSTACILYTTPYWTVMLHQDQTYLGRCTIFLNRPCEALSGVTTEEWMDFRTSVVVTLESAFKDAFDATMFNWSCLMNNAYKETPPSPYVHFHFRPRYDHDVSFAGMKFQDVAFGEHYRREQRQVVSDTILERIKQTLLPHLT